MELTNHKVFMSDHIGFIHVTSQYSKLAFENKSDPLPHKQTFMLKLSIIEEKFEESFVACKCMLLCTIGTTTPPIGFV